MPRDPKGYPRIYLVATEKLMVTARVTTFRSSREISQNVPADKFISLRPGRNILIILLQNIDNVSFIQYNIYHASELKVHWFSH